jgi:hypothetical protein
MRAAGVVVGIVLRLYRREVQEAREAAAQARGQTIVTLLLQALLTVAVAAVAAVEMARLIPEGLSVVPES